MGCQREDLLYSLQWVRQVHTSSKLLQYRQFHKQRFQSSPIIGQREVEGVQVFPEGTMGKHHEELDPMKSG